MHVNVTGSSDGATVDREATRLETAGSQCVEMGANRRLSLVKANRGAAPQG